MSARGKQQQQPSVKVRRCPDCQIPHGSRRRCVPCREARRKAYERKRHRELREARRTNRKAGWDTMTLPTRLKGDRPPIVADDFRLAFKEMRRELERQCNTAYRIDVPSSEQSALDILFPWRSRTV